MGVASIYSVCGNTTKFFGKRPHTEMSIPERVEYFTEMDGKMTNINCTRFADSKPKALCLIAGQVQDGDVIILPGTSNFDFHLVRTTELAFCQTKCVAYNTFIAWLKQNPHPTRDTTLCDLTDDPPLGEEVYIVCCNLTLVDTHVENFPIRNGLVK